METSGFELARLDLKGEARTLIWADNCNSPFSRVDAVKFIRFPMAGVVALVVNKGLMQI